MGAREQRAGGGLLFKLKGRILWRGKLMSQGGSGRSSVPEMVGEDLDMRRRVLGCEQRCSWRCMLGALHGTFVTVTRGRTLRSAMGDGVLKVTACQQDLGGVMLYVERIYKNMHLNFEKERAHLCFLYEHF